MAISGRAKWKLNTLMAILGKQTKKYPGGGTFILPRLGYFYFAPMGTLLS